MIGLVALLLAASPAEIEGQAARTVAAEFESKGQGVPVSDPALTAAARVLAQRALAGSAEDAAEPLAITEAISGADGEDPVPRAIVVRAAPVGDALKALAERHDYVEEGSSHVGIGAAVSPERGAVVVLVSERKATFQPFPHKLAKAGVAKSLCGDLLPPLEHAEVYVTAPDGSAAKLPLVQDAGPRFCASIPFPKEGRYTLEVVGKGPRGPEVTSLFFVEVGKVAERAGAERTAEPTTLPQARAALAERINGLRHAFEAPPLVEDDLLDTVAQAYADRMGAEGFFSHVAPDGQDMRARLRGAGYVYTGAGENLGLANGPLAAHFGIEHSPGHRKNLLEPAFSRLGVGVFFRQLPDRRQAIVVELYATPSRVSANPLQDAYRALQDKRQSFGLPFLIRSDVLEKLALDHAARALKEEAPRAELPDSALHQRVFESLDEVKSASVDVFVADDPSLLTDSKSLKDARNDRVGIGAVKGDSAAYGRAKWWVVVIYASTK